jgi:hypothetical protein
MLRDIEAGQEFASGVDTAGVGSDLHDKGPSWLIRNEDSEDTNQCREAPSFLPMLSLIVRCSRPTASRLRRCSVVSDSVASGKVAVAVGG